MRMNLHLNPIAKKCLKMFAADVLIASFLNPMYFAAGILWERGDWLFWPCMMIIMFLTTVTLGIGWYATYLILRNSVESSKIEEGARNGKHK
jgi:small-conductance mechanosensitive channel